MPTVSNDITRILYNATGRLSRRMCWGGLFVAVLCGGFIPGRSKPLPYQFVRSRFVWWVHIADASSVLPQGKWRRCRTRRGIMTRNACPRANRDSPLQRQMRKVRSRFVLRVHSADRHELAIGEIRRQVPTSWCHQGKTFTAGDVIAHRRCG